MAIALGYRIAIALAPAGGAAATRVIRWAEGPGLSSGTSLWNRLLDPSETDADLTSAVSEARGTLSEVATYSGTFEVRRLQLELGITGASLLDEDVRVMTFHLVKLASGTPTAEWVAGDFTAANAAVDAMWTTLKPNYSSNVFLKALKYYKAGPAINPPQVPVHVADRSVAGTSSQPMLPPQVALSVTEIAGAKRGWGRFYMPAPCTGPTSTITSINSFGRPPSAFLTTFGDALDTMYEAFEVANLHPVVYRPTLAAGRPHKGAGSLPERPAEAQTVEKLQLDDVYDVIRRRRWENPTLRLQREITQP